MQGRRDRETSGAIKGSIPVVVLVDDLSASAAELFAAIMQDNKLGLLYGTRTNGAGGVVGQYDVGLYSETFASMAVGIAIRNKPIVTMEYPAVPYIENIGVRPDVTSELATVGNLTSHGKAFTDGFTEAIVNYIKSKAP